MATDRTGLVRCPCGWRGVPTYIGGQAIDVCPACKRPGAEEVPDGQ